MASKREAWFLAECKTAEGAKKSIWVDREGSTIHLSGAISGYGNHICHEAVDTVEQVKAEISLIYELEVISVKTPQEVASEINQAKPSGSAQQPR